MTKLAEFIERDGGHVATAMLLILLASVLYKLGVPNAEDIIPFALGTMGRSMMGKNGVTK